MNTDIQTSSLTLPEGFTLCAVATRADPGFAARDSFRQQTLLFTTAGCFELLGLDGDGEVRAGLQVPITQRLPDGRTQSFDCTSVHDAATDPADGCIYLALRTAVWRLDASNTVTLAAGHARAAGDQDGAHAGFQSAFHLASGGLGQLFIVDSGRNHQLRKMYLPTLRASAPARVVTLPVDLPGTHAPRVAYNCQAPGGQLYVASRHAVYVLVGANLRLVAGAEGSPGHADGPGPEARFQPICDMAVDATQSLYIACTPPLPLQLVIRKLSPDGTVSTLAMPYLPVRLEFPSLAILPHGWLLAFEYDKDKAHVLLKLGLQPCGRPSAEQCDSRPLHLARLVQDFAALLDDCSSDSHSDSSGAGSGGTSDVVVVAGGCRFSAHRAVLAARCEYFRSRIAGPDWDATAGELTLEGADPAAFRCLLRYMYTGDTAFPPDLLCPIAELAAMMLLREACGEAQRQMLRGVTPGRFVACLLLADGHAHTGMGFPELLEGLVGWYVENHGAVMEAAEAEVEGLMASHPKLVMQLHRALGTASRRARMA